MDGMEVSTWPTRVRKEKRNDAPSNTCRAAPSKVAFDIPLDYNDPCLHNFPISEIGADDRRAYRFLGLFQLEQLIARSRDLRQLYSFDVSLVCLGNLRSCLAHHHAAERVSVAPL